MAEAEPIFIPLAVTDCELLLNGLTALAKATDEAAKGGVISFDFKNLLIDNINGMRNVINREKNRFSLENQRLRSKRKA